MKKKNGKKKQVLQFEKTYFLSCSFLAAPLLCISEMICGA
jgi:hypothetical protein